MLVKIIVSFVIFIVAVLMTMVGKGGGNFYVVILALAGVPMHQAAATGQFILFTASAAAMLVFQKNKSLSWALAGLIGVTTAIAALAGGYFSHLFSGFSLKIIFAVMLAVAGALMLIPIREKRDFPAHSRAGTITLTSSSEPLTVHLFTVIPVTLLTGFGSGMVGVSGGSFLVPLMVLACGASMRTAVSTASSLIAATALMGFIGHAARGDFNPSWAIPLACVTIAGGLVGGKFALKTKPKHLKRLFAYTNWLAALFMVFSAFRAKGAF